MKVLLDMIVITVVTEPEDALERVELEDGLDGLVFERAERDSLVRADIINGSLLSRIVLETILEAILETVATAVRRLELPTVGLVASPRTLKLCDETINASVVKFAILILRQIDVQLASELTLHCSIGPRARACTRVHRRRR